MYGPVRTVVWEGRGREAPPYPDLAHQVAPPGRGGQDRPSVPRLVGYPLALLRFAQNAFIRFPIAAFSAALH